MIPLASSRARYRKRLCRKPAAPPRALRRALEALEDRTVPAAVAPPPGLVSWWTADNTAADLRGLNNATLSNGATYAPGEVQQALDFDGMDDRASLADSDSLKFTASMTIEGWILVRAFPSPNQTHGEILFRGDDRGGLDPYSIAVESNGKFSFLVSSLSAGIQLETPVPTGQWIHVAATLDDATGAMRIYVNGSQATQAVTAVRPFRDLDPASNPGIGIGNHAGYPNTPHNFPFNGLIDELSVYDRALSASEIQAISAAGSDGKIKDPNYVGADFPSVAGGTAGSTPPVTFTIRRVGNLTGQATVNWTTADGTAAAGKDYVAASGQVVFQDGESQKTVSVSVIGNSTPEPNRTFRILLATTAPGFTSGWGQATIVDDDVGVSVDDGAAAEGDARIGQTMGALVSQAANGGLDFATGLAWGPDGNLYVGSLNTNQILRFDGTTGAFLGVFIDAGQGLAPDAPFIQGLQFRPDGKLYVLSRNTAQVQRFDAATGAFLDAFIPSGSGGLRGAKGMTVGPDGNWYVSSGDTNQVLRYSGATGAFLGEFVPAGSGGLSNPRALTFGPDGSLYVASSASNAVLRYNGQTGAFLDAFVPAGSGGLSFPGELLFSAGSLYVASQSSNEVLRYDAQTGAFLDRPATAGLGGLNSPLGLLLDANNNLLAGSSAEVLRYGPRSLAAFTVRLSLPSAAPVTVSYATADGTAKAGSDYVAASGTLTFAPGQMTRTILVRTLDDTLYEGDETFTVTLSGPVGATITRGQAVGTIADNEAPVLQVAAAAVNGGAAQRSRVTEITVTFNGVASLPADPAAAFRLTRTGPGGPTGDVTISVDLSGSTAARTVARLTFSGPLTQAGSLTDGLYRLTVSAAAVSGSGGPLDGDANGAAGGDFAFDLHRMFGDTNGDKRVDALDLFAFAGGFGKKRGEAGYRDDLDSNNDGAVDALDLFAFAGNFGKALP